MTRDDSRGLPGNGSQAGVVGTMVYAPSPSGLTGDSPDHAAGRIEVRVGRGLAELLALERHWRSLAGRLPQPFFIHAFDWQRAYLEHLEPHAEATLYVSFFDNGQAIAIFPLRRVRRTVGYIPMWLWELPTHPHLVLGDALIAPDWNTAALVRLLVATLNRRQGQSWDALHLPNLPDDAVAVGGRLAEALPWTHQERAGSSMHFECRELDAALANCSSGFRRNLRRQGRKLAQQGAVTLTLAHRGAELDAAFAEFLRLEASGWKGGSGKFSAISLHPRLLGFYADLKDRFGAGDACLISLLKLDGVAIAAQFCLLAGDTLYVQKIAYDEAWSAEAPGSQLLYRLLEYCCGEPRIRRLSLVTGPAWAVGRWNPESRDVWEVYVFKGSLTGLCGLALRRLKAQVWAPAKARWLRLRAARTEAAQPAADRQGRT